ncbi:flagellin lysine-N-methylase [Magnetococcales bacterium HHB-1]
MLKMTTLQGLTHFHCIAALCEDSCCSQWVIPLSQKDLDRFKKHGRFSVIENNRVTRSEIEKQFASATTSETKKEEEQFIRINDQGACVFLNQDKLCDLHRQWGDQILPQTCAMFPRTLNRVGFTVELMGSLACPELARLLLLHPDAVNRITFEKEDIPRTTFQNAVDLHPDNPYIYHLDDIRELFITLFQPKTYPFDSRLVFASYFAQHTSAFFYQRITTPVVERLQKEIQRIQQKNVQEPLHQRLHTLEVPGNLGMQIIQMVLTHRLQSHDFHRLARAAVSQLIHRELHDDEDVIETDVSALWTNYQKYKTALLSRHGERIDRYFSHFVILHVLSKWYFTHHNLSLFIRDLIIRTLILKFLFFSITGPQIFSDTPQSHKAQQEILDQHAVYIFQKFAKTVEHAPTLLEKIAKKLDQQGINELAHLFFLSRF